MVRLFSSVFAAFALVAMAIAMSGGVEVAAAQPAAVDAADGHCAGGDAPSGHEMPAPEMGCVGACTGLPAAPPCFGESATILQPAFASVPARALVGVMPDHETPPPRFAPAI